MVMLCDESHASPLLSSSFSQACESTRRSVRPSVCRCAEQSSESEASPQGTRCHGRLPLTEEAIALGITAIIQRRRGGRSSRGLCLHRRHTALLSLCWDCSRPPTGKRKLRREKGGNKVPGKRKRERGTWKKKRSLHESQNVLRVERYRPHTHTHSLSPTLPLHL